MNGSIGSLFDNREKILPSDQAAALIGFSKRTLYDMHYRPRKYDVPAGLFLKNGRKLLVRTDVLKIWFISRNKEITNEN